ncbi:hypothetical protein HNR44_002820 [Geomicrobium halophilum]|uniref:Uncharacterized protein n=1 Tax=Geomicrobium halophilum TaxID=549000 RepID=A0A841PPY4_9BACL|nr:CBO0543 family protein [Geomicrobium halophilum]MBB6450830.1 hypothetical protein [Geomicrobium halophilum]
MKKNKVDHFILRGTLIFTLFSLTILLLRKKSSIKDWVLAYLWNGLTNGMIDTFVASYKFVQYPVRFFPNVFPINVLFDYIVYPTVTILINQMTEKDQPKTILFKILAFTAPMTVLEYLMEKKTNLIKWSKRWKWYHTFVTMTFKSITTRVLVGFVRKVSDKRNE